MFSFLKEIAVSIGRWRESREIASRDSRIKSLESTISELRFEVKSLKEDIKLNGIAIHQLTAITERDLQRITSEAAVYTFNTEKLGGRRDDGTR